MKRTRLFVMTIALLLIFTACGSNLSDDEKLMLSCAKQVPGEFNIKDDYEITDNPWIIKTDSQTYVVIPVHGLSETGAPVYALPIFVDGAYYMDGMEDVPTNSGSTEDLDKLIVLRNINAAEAYGFEKIEIDKEIIMNEMK